MEGPKALVSPPAETPLVSVHMLTYNHEPYIRQAIESVLMQRAPFPFELVIGDDRSTDGTREIIAGYCERYPAIFRVLLHEKNLGLHDNFMECLGACRGRYVAILEGDDFWVTEDKLAKQVAVLESHPECAIAFGRARVFYEDGSREAWEYPMTEQITFTLDDLLRQNMIPNCTAMYRLGLLLETPGWLRDVPFMDWALHILLARYGTLHLLPETLAGYRVHAGGLYSRLSENEVSRKYAEFYRLLTANGIPAPTEPASDGG